MGNNTPKLRDMKNMCIHRMVSTGSNVITWPGGNSSCSCAETDAQNVAKTTKTDSGRMSVETFEAIAEAMSY